MVAEPKFSGASVTVGREAKAKGEVTIYADGQNAIFLEFGAGWGATHPLGFEFGYMPDSWSKEHKQQFHKYQYWVYMGEKYTEIPAGMGMYEAGKQMRQRIVSIAKEVFCD